MKLLDRSIRLPSKCSTLTIIPFGCLHSDDPGFNQDLWNQCVEEIRTTPHCLAIGCGDYRNFLRTTARRYLKAYVADEESWRDMDAMVRREVDHFTKKHLEPIKHKLVGLADGNHLYEFSTGGNDTQMMCRLLDVPYLEKLSIIRLTVELGHHDRTRVLRILVHHGDWSSGYTRIGGDLNAAEMKAMGWDADVFIFGHTHRLVGWIKPIMSVPLRGELRVVERPMAVLRTGSFVKGYLQCPTLPGYVEKKLLHPTNLGYPRLMVHFGKQWDKEKYRSEVSTKGPDKAKGSATRETVKMEVRF